MTKMTDALALVLIGTDAERPAAERLKALEQANELRRDLKVGWAKLGTPEGFNFGAELSELEDLAKLKAPEPEAANQVIDERVGDHGHQEPLSDEELPEHVHHTDGEASADVPDVPKVDRGGIGRLVNLLLTTTDDDYKTIVAKVKAAHPEAKTTARSVASVAADLRRAGAEVPTRRKAKAAAD